MIDLQNDGHEPVDIGILRMKGEDLRAKIAANLLRDMSEDLRKAVARDRWIDCHTSYRDDSADARDMVDDMGFDGAAQFLTDCQLQGWVVIFRRKR